MKTIKKYMALALVFIIIALGCIMLMIDYKTLTSAWLGLLGAAVCFGAGILLGYWLDHKKMLPE